uniref:Uncharacterized protein n=1 Tax=Mycena chlorophos TaxID=658473 RepID=A0ABQ0L571_MYCCL|nr:predicted protein [Mycena chlorophos]
MFSNPDMVRQLMYLSERKPVEGAISDWCDASYLAELRETNVVVDGEKLPHKYFSQPTDLALAFSSDGVLINGRRGGPSTSPMVMQIMNLHPDRRTHREFSLRLGNIGGPKAPRNMHSYEAPLDEELVELARGVPTYNALTGEIFILRAYNIYKFGDMRSMEKFLNTKGASSPDACWTCSQTGFLHPEQTIYFAALAKPTNTGIKGRSWPAANPPIRTEEDYRIACEKIANAPTRAFKESLQKHFGINGPPSMRRVGSMDRPRSYATDLMHMIPENVIPNLVKLITGTFKGLDDGHENYELGEELMDEVFIETGRAMKTIPSAFVRNLAGGPTKFPAEGWLFWFTHMAPGLLQGRLPSKYHTHLCALAKIIKTCLEPSLTHERINELELEIVDWALEKYEE